MNDNNYIVLMAGGAGTRLWPVSREIKPKQFHKFASDKSLLQETYDRIKDLVPRENIFLSLGATTLKTTQKQLKDIYKTNYIIEPLAKNTAPSIAFAAAYIFKKNPLANIATISSDHTVNKVANYQETFRKAFAFIQKNSQYLVTIGIKPDSPQTGYGYIKIGRRLSNTRVMKVEKFVEKPNLEEANEYLKSGKYLWNAGYFIFRASEILKMYDKYCPEIYSGIKKIQKAISLKDEQKVVSMEFKKFPKIPIDTALAEKVENIAVIPAELGWSDIGNWSSIYDLLSPGKLNGLVTQGHHVGIDDRNCLFFAQDKLLATVGLENIIIVDTPDATLVCRRDKAQEIKGLIEKLKESGKTKYL